MQGALIDEDITLEILEAFIKKLNKVAAGWNSKPYH